MAIVALYVCMGTIDYNARLGFTTMSIALATTAAI